MSTGASIVLERENDIWVAEDVAPGVASQGEIREQALANLDEAVELAEESRDPDTSAPIHDVPWFDDG